MAATPPIGRPSRRIVTMLEAKTHRSRLVEAIASARQTDVVIARNG